MPDYPVTVQMFKVLESQLKELAEKVGQLAGVVSDLQDKQAKAAKVAEPTTAAPAPTKARSVWD
jgi:hypothetical protein